MTNLGAVLADNQIGLLAGLADAVRATPAGGGTGAGLALGQIVSARVVAGTGNDALVLIDGQPYTLSLPEAAAPGTTLPLQVLQTGPALQFRLMNQAPGVAASSAPVVEVTLAASAVPNQEASDPEGSGSPASEPKSAPAAAGPQPNAGRIYGDQDPGEGLFGLAPRPTAAAIGTGAAAPAAVGTESAGPIPPSAAAPGGVHPPSVSPAGTASPGPPEVASPGNETGNETGPIAALPLAADRPAPTGSAVTTPGLAPEDVLLQASPGAPPQAADLAPKLQMVLGGSAPQAAAQATPGATAAALSGAVSAWAGAVWPGQKARIEIDRESERRAFTSEPVAGWRATLHMELPALGDLSAEIVWGTSGVRLSVRTQGRATATALQETSPDLLSNLRGLGLRVTALGIVHEK